MKQTYRQTTRKQNARSGTAQRKATTHTGKSVTARQKAQRAARRKRAIRRRNFKIALLLATLGVSLFVLWSLLYALKQMEEPSLGKLVEVIEEKGVTEVLFPSHAFSSSSKFEKEIIYTREDLAAMGIPEALIDLYERNAETHRFVLDYSSKSDTASEIIDLSSEISKGIIPLFLQWDERWGYKTYGDGFFAINGCGPTCISMVYCGLTGDGLMTPHRVGELCESEGYYVYGTGSSWYIMTDITSELGLTCHTVSLNEDAIKEQLALGRPIIVNVGPGTFTQVGHFMVITAIDDKGQVNINDPNSQVNSSNKWDLDEILADARAMWSYSYTAD